MGALTKLCSNVRKCTAIFFSVTLPQAIRLAFLAARVLWISCKRARVKCKYMALINKQSSRFVYTSLKSRPWPDSVSCSICLSDFEEGEEGRELVMCKHAFHRKCIERWLLHGNQGTCPLCKRLLLPKEMVAEHQRVQIAEEQDDNRSEVELALFFLSALHGRNCHRFQQ